MVDTHKVEPGGIYWIRCSKLWINENCQGREHPATLRFLRANWKGHADEQGRCHLPDILKATPELECLDGRHRRKIAMEKHGDPLVRVLITEHLTDAQKSAYYLDIAKVHARDAADIFRNAATAGEEDAGYAAYTETKRALETVGLHVDKNGSWQATIRCPKNVERIQRLGGSPLVVSAATLCRATWTNDRDRFDGRVLEGVALFLHAHPEIDREAFAHKVGKFKCSSVIGRAHAGREAKLKSDLGSSLPALVGHAVREIYNRGRRSGRVGES